MTKNDWNTCIFNGLFPCEIPNPLSSFTQKAVVIQVVKVSGTFFVKDVSFRPLICISSQIHVRGKLRLIGSTFAMLCVFFWCCLCGSYNGNREGGKKGCTRFTGTVFQLSVLGELSVLGKLSILGDTTANKILCFDFPQSHPGFCETDCFFFMFFATITTEAGWTQTCVSTVGFHRTCSSIFAWFIGA